MLHAMLSRLALLWLALVARALPCSSQQLPPECTVQQGAPGYRCSIAAGQTLVLSSDAAALLPSVVFDGAGSAASKLVVLEGVRLPSKILNCHAAQHIPASPCFAVLNAACLHHLQALLPGSSIT